MHRRILHTGGRLSWFGPVLSLRNRTEPPTSIPHAYALARIALQIVCRPLTEPVVLTLMLSEGLLADARERSERGRLRDTSQQVGPTNLGE